MTHRPFTIAVLLPLLLSLCVAQTNPINAHPWEYGNVCWQDEQSQLNSFAKQLQGDASLVGYIVVYAGIKSCPNEAKYRAERAKKWVVKRGVKADRVIAVDGGYRVEVQTVLHLQPESDPPYESYSMLKKQDVSISGRCGDKNSGLRPCVSRK